jgi:hypothetical protein
VPTKLRKLELSEVSLVRRGANPKASVLLFKSDDMSESNGNETQKSAVQKFLGALRSIATPFARTPAERAEVEKGIRSAAEALGAEIDEDAPSGDGDDIGKMGKCSCGGAYKDGKCDKCKAVMKDGAQSFVALRARSEISSDTYALQDSIRSILEDEAVADKSSAITATTQQFLSTVLSRVSLFKSGERDPSGTSPADPSANPATPPETTPMPEPTLKSGEQPSPADVLKSLTPEARAIVEKSQADAAAAIAKADAAADEIAKMRAEQARTVNIAKSQEMLGNSIAGSPEEFAEHVLAKLDEKGREVLAGVMKSANTAIASAAPTREIGKSSARAGSAEQKLDALAQEYAKTHSVSIEKAYVAVSETPEGKELYRKSLDEAGTPAGGGE